MADTMLLWGLGLMAGALVLLIVDLFVPTFGVLALTALGLAIGGVVCLFNVSQTWGLIGLAMIVFGGPTVFFFGLQIMPTTPLGRKLVLGSDETPVEPGQTEATDEVARAMRQLIGSEGVVVTDLRPVGTIRIGDKRFDALAETTMIRAGASIRVVAIEGGSLKVRAI